MKRIDYGYDESVMEEVLPNGLKVYLYNTTKTKNFYITVSTHFGAEVLRYKKDSEVYDVTLGSAHFLEHRVMDFTKNEEAQKKISEFGSMTNAYTTYNGTNYNIFGHDNIIENIKLLFDCVFKANIKDEDVENERGIILEEYDMYFDDPYFVLHNNLNQNIFSNSYMKYPVLGSKEGIENVSASELRRLYKDFYTPDNMFVIITGDFNQDEVMEFIREYTKNLKNVGDKPRVLKMTEKDEVVCNYEEMILPVNETKVILGYKVKVSKNISLLKQKLILSMVLSNVFGLSGDAYEELNNSCIKRFNWGYETTDNYFLVYFKASTEKSDEFIRIVEKYILELDMDEKSLERKKRARLSTLILSFEDILGIEDILATELFTYNKLINDRDEIIKEITLNEVKEFLSELSFDNKSILKILGE